MLEVLERNFQERDRQLTYTAHGPHKADLRIRADGAPVEDTLSRGQLTTVDVRLTSGAGRSSSPVKAGGGVST